MKMVVCDLDGTLLRSDKSISAGSIEAIKALEGVGIDFTVATARAPRTAFEFLANKIQNEYIVCYNGAEIYKAGKLIYKKYIELDEIKFMVVWLQSNYEGIEIALEIDDVLYANFDVSIMGWESVHSNIDFSTFELRPAAKILIHLSNINNIELIRNIVPESCSFVVLDKGMLGQITHREATKIKGVKRLAEMCSCTLDEMVAFGDDFSDIEIITQCGIGVAMGNAEEEVKRAANIVTKTNDEDGVAYILENLIKGNVK